MILSKFLDKTLEAAKKSALQIAKGDYSQLKAIFPDDQDDRSNKHLMNGRPHKGNRGSSESVAAGKDPEPGVVFERSATSSSATNEKATTNKLDKRLKSIRKYAAQQTDEGIDAVSQTNAQTEEEPPSTKKEPARSAPPSATQLYNRKAIRKKKPSSNHDNLPGKGSTAPDASHSTNESSNSQNGHEPLFDKFMPPVDKDGISSIAGSTDVGKERVTANSKDLHKRLDRLESLMHLALSTSDGDVVSHPLFHRLVHKGVSKRLIRSWFEELTKQGLHPEKQSELFSSKLLQLIDELLQESQADAPAKTMLFTGRAGSGKTHVITKLLSLPDFLKNKKVAVAFFHPDTGQPGTNYSILEPFCKDHDINFYSFQTADGIEELQDDWPTFDHFLIDTPALDRGSDTLIEAINLLKKKLGKQSDYEIHYLVNTAVNGTAFNDPLAHAIDADHIVLTHIDQSLKWGKAVQLLTNSRYKLRYISSGPSMTDELLPFIPLKFARKLLRA